MVFPWNEFVTYYYLLSTYFRRFTSKFWIYNLIMWCPLNEDIYGHVSEFSCNSVLGWVIYLIWTLFDLIHCWMNISKSPSIYSNSTSLIFPLHFHLFLVNIFYKKKTHKQTNKKKLMIFRLVFFALGYNIPQFGLHTAIEMDTHNQYSDLQ